MSTVRHIGYFPKVGGFATCIPQVDPATLGFTQYHYPIGLSLDAAMRWYWIVRRWEADVSLTADYGGGETYSGSSTSYATRVDYGSALPLTNEKELICGTNVTTLIWEAEILIGDPPEPQPLYSGVASIIPAIQTNTPPIIYWDGLYYPRLNMDMLLVDILMGISPQTVPPQVAEDVVLTIDGFPVTVYYGGGGIPSGTIELTPFEDWPYEP